jgi:hypothetical protein
LSGYRSICVIRDVLRPDPIQLGIHTLTLSLTYWRFCEPDEVVMGVPTISTVSDFERFDVTDNSVTLPKRFEFAVACHIGPGRLDVTQRLGKRGAAVMG